MKTTVYIIPGFQETCKEARYRKLASVLKDKGYIVKRVEPDWLLPLSLNVFVPKKNSILIGFSFGAIIAYLHAKKYPVRVKRVIFCSMTPINKLTWCDLRKEYGSYMDKITAKRNADDVTAIKISLGDLKMSHITLAGELEKITADALIPNTKHFLSREYINCIKNLV